MVCKCMCTRVSVCVWALGYAVVVHHHEFSRCSLTADVTKLPTASTCFNLFILPPYRSFSLLRDRVLTAVRCGSHGFTFA